MSSKNPAEHISVLGLLIFGTISSLFSKIVYELQGPGRDDRVHFFRKPWATTTMMFIAMAFCLPISSAVSAYNRRQKRRALGLPEGQEPLLAAPEEGGRHHERKTVTAKQVALLAVPTIFDLAATVLMSVGLLYVSASIYQMMRGAEMLFAALFSVVFLHRPLNSLHYQGIGLCVLGISAVGASSVLAQRGDDESGASASQALFGMGLIILSQAVQAGQVTVEDFAMDHIGFEPLKVVGFEGVFGTILMLAIALPIVQRLPGEEGAGIHEDSIDTWEMIKSSRSIVAVLAVNTVALTLYNIAGMFVTDEVGAAARTVLETMRTLFVWLTDLAIYYSPIGSSHLGEPWNRWSYLQAAGFAVLVYGTFKYGQGDELEEEKHMTHHKEAERRWSSMKASMTMYKTRPVTARTSRIRSLAAQAIAAMHGGTTEHPQV